MDEKRGRELSVKSMRDMIDVRVLDISCLP